MEYLWYNEKLPGDLNGIELDESTGWTPTRQTDRSYNKGFWIRYKLKNDTKIKEFGLDHENIFPRTIFVAKRYNYSNALSAGRVDKDGKRFFYDIDVVESPEERVDDSTPHVLPPPVVFGSNKLPTTAPLKINCA